MEEILEAFLKAKLKKTDLSNQQPMVREWVSKASKRVGQLKFATHNGKYTHSKVGKEVSCLAIPTDREADGYLRTGNCDTASVDSLEGFDCLGNAAVLDVYKFLSLKLADGETVFAHFERKSDYLRNQLGFGKGEFEVICSDMLSIRPDGKSMETSDLLKQVYFPTEDGYHLLSILTPSVLMTEWKKRIQAIVFSPAAKEGRAARKSKDVHEGFAELYDLTLMGFGGTKTQNVGVLNSKNRGYTYLLPSIPPSLNRSAVRLPRTDFFVNCLRSIDFAPLFGQIGSVVDTDRNNMHLRNHRDQIFRTIVDKVIQISWAVRASQGGWSQRDYYRNLPNYQKIWLDADHEQERMDSDDWKEEVVDAMSRYIISSLNKEQKDFMFGDEEFLYVRGLVDAAKEGLS